MKLYDTAKKLVCLCAVLFLSTNTMVADWDPDCLSIDNESALEILSSSELVDLEHKIFEYVKNSWCSENKAKLLFELMVLTKPQVSVEIGAFTGSSTLPFLAALKYIGSGKAYVIDAWSTEEAIRGLPKEDVNTIWWETLNMQAVQNHFMHMLTSWSLHPYCEVLHMTSQQAANQIPFIDFLHLDGNFSEAGALQDSEVYLPKVKSGGYILLSNTLVMIGGKATKMQALWPIFDQCDIICELDSGNTLLFRKN